MKKKIAYQGTKASFSEIAIEHFFGMDIECIGKETFRDVFDSLQRQEVECAALPIENSLIGPIVENFDLFADYPVSIIGELRLPIEHCLVGSRGQRLEEIQKVYSHPKALAQCTVFFMEHPWIEPVAHFDTAGAAAEIACDKDPSKAAIASRKTADIYPLEILKPHLEDDPSNTTRFLFLEKGESSLSRREGKCSLLFTLDHRPGSLAEILTWLAQHGLNLTQIVSRPIKEKPFEYLFFVDILFAPDVDFEIVFNGLKQKTNKLNLLGLYGPAQ